MSQEERRRTQRAKQHFMVHYRGPGQGTWDAVPLKDLSRDGARFFCSHPLKVGDELRLRLSFPFVKEEVRAQARVIWTRSIGGTAFSMAEIGVTFLILDPAVQEAINAAVESFLKLPS